MAAARGLSLTLMTATCFGRHSPNNLIARLSPLVIQTRDKGQSKSRIRAPHVPTQKGDKWSKVDKKKVSATLAPKAAMSATFMARVPQDDVWIRTHYPRPRFSLEECLVRHKELADPTMLDNMDGFVYADMLLNMKTNKKTKFLANVKGTLLLPHRFQFQESMNQKIAVFCKTIEDQQVAKSLGATLVGCEDLVKQVSEGIVDKDDMDVFLCTPDTIIDIIPIRARLRDKFPSKQKGSVGNDVKEMWTLYTEGITYSSQKESDAVSKLQVPLGQLKMPISELVENFEAYVSALCSGRSKSLGPLITQMFIVAPPSTERFLLPVENYVPGYEQTKKSQDTDSEDEAEEQAAKRK